VAAISLIQPKASPLPLTRVGGGGDGGYLIPDDFTDVVACFSPGVGKKSDFELALAERGIRSFMADYSVDGPPIKHAYFNFEKLFVATHSEQSKLIRLDEWISKKEQTAGDLILQMDIEGHEWPILADVTAETLSRFRIIVLELHELDNLLTNPLGIEIFKSVFQKLNKQFSVVHLHANSGCGLLNYQGVQIPRVIEVTLIRNDRYQVSNELFDPTIPSPLDAPNVPGQKELRLTKEWLG